MGDYEILRKQHPEISGLEFDILNKQVEKFKIGVDKECIQMKMDLFIDYFQIVNN